MKLSLNWIRDYVDLPEDADLSRLAYDLTMSTVEVEGAADLGAKFDHMVVGQIAEVLPHPNADKLRVCRTDIGGDVKDIVCGGCNLAAGMKVAVAEPGAFVRWHGEGEPVEIRNTKLRGIESYGMICASSEIGLADLFPASAEAEIIDLSAFDAPAGTPLADALGLRDIILEIDNKSMTNRPDLWGHYGIAREIAALYDLPLKPIEPYRVSCAEPFPVRIEDTVRCPRYIGVRIDGLSVKPSPFSIQSRIWRVGMRPINALVDVTNYVMLATGQPTHAFDRDNISGGITVRRAAEGEGLTLLNAKELKLCPDDLVIADDEEAVALAGVMGGAKDSILPGTTGVILEVANFESTGVRRTALRYDNRTEASSRYEKAVDRSRCDQALSMAMSCFAGLYPDMKVTGFTDCYPEKDSCNEIDVSLNWLERRLGKRIPNETIEKKLGALGYKLAFAGDSLHVTVPTWRSTGDVSMQNDIMEEVARMYGYENFEPTSITATFDGAVNQLDKDLVRRIKEYLAFRCGMREIFTYPWMKQQFVDATVGGTEGMLSLSTPPSPEERFLRSTLIPNLVGAAADNERFFPEFSLFEEAQVLLDRDYTSPYDPSEKLPLQRRHIAGAFAGSASDVTGLFRRAKGVLEAMPALTHMEGFSFEKREKPYWADDTVWLNVFRGEEKLGDLALLGKKASMACGIRSIAVMLFELDTDAMKPFTSRTNGYARLPAFPEVEYDISLLFPSETKWSDISAAILSKSGGIVKGAEFVDEYRGKQVPQGKKSVTARLKLASGEKTLTSEEIERAAGQVVKRLGHLLGAELRSK